jgi:branched-chain amino acid transport system ATP-binding protein
LAPPVLEVEGLVAGYGGMRIIDGVNLSLSAGEVLGLVGPNGMGKTTLLRSLIGELPAKAGVIRLGARDITREPTAARARLGLGYVPQGRQIFPDLTVRENLEIGEAMRSDPSGIPAILERFKPLRRLLQRPGRALSGGEQQLLALARCLLGRPRVILLDEPSEGIQPSIVEEIAEHLRELSTRESLAILLVEQDLQLVARLARRAFVVRKGQLVRELAAADLVDPAIVRDLLGV